MPFRILCALKNLLLLHGRIFNPFRKEEARFDGVALRLRVRAFRVGKDALRQHDAEKDGLRRRFVQRGGRSKQVHHRQHQLVERQRFRHAAGRHQPKENRRRHGRN